MNYNTLDPSECEFYEIAAVDDLPNGERLFVEIGENYLVLFNIAGEFYAIADLCSHDNGPLGDGDLEDAPVMGRASMCAHGQGLEFTGGRRYLRVSGSLY